MLNSIKTLKRYSKATLNVFLEKILWWWQIFFMHMIHFLCRIEILLLKLFEILGFLVILFKIPQTPGFEATLYGAV